MSTDDRGQCRAHRIRAAHRRRPLVLGQRLSEWCGHGPIIEEDIALANVALDLIGQARLLLALAGRLEGKGRDEDALAFLRIEPQYLQPDDRRAAERATSRRTILRNFLVAAWQRELWQGLAIRPMPSSRRSRPRPEGVALPPAARGGLDGAPRRRHRGIARAHATRARQLWPYTAEFFSAYAEDPPSPPPASGRPGRAWKRHGKPSCGRYSRSRR